MTRDIIVKPVENVSRWPLSWAKLSDICGLPTMLRNWIFLQLFLSTVLLLALVQFGPAAAVQSPQGDQPRKRQSDPEVAVPPELEKSLLGMFRMSSRPTRHAARPPVPPYMLELYRKSAGLEDDEEVEVIDHTSTTMDLPPGTVIRSFYDLGGGGQDENHAVLHFNVTMQHKENVDSAELRIYCTNESLPSNSINKPHRLDLYQVLQPATAKRDAITSLVDTKRINSLQNSRWQSFDITEIVRKWRSGPSTVHHGLEVKFTQVDGQPSSAKHVRLRRSAELSESDWHAVKPFLVTFTTDPDHVVTNSRSRRKRATRTKEERQRKKKERQEQRRLRKLRRKHCQRHSLYVDFASVKWDDWIIAPQGYEAYYCEGECPFSMHNILNTTNHAIIRNMVNAMHPPNRPIAPPPCCVPKELSDISLLYYDENEVVVLKVYQDMVVESCGCL